LSKAKFILFGFTKAGSLLSMFATFGLYLTLYSWKFALGFVLSIYVHEMGHVAAFRRFGVPVSAPMFIPGFGAFVRGSWMPHDVGQSARVALAGPLWGLYAALGCFAMAAWTGDTFWSALATVGAQINLLNLIPAFILDGGGAVKALPKSHRIALMGLTLGGFIGMGVGLYFLVFLGMAYQVWKKDYAQEPDWGVTMQYAGLLVALGVMCLVPVDTGAIR
jgi:Zn-dependent protease